MPTVAELYPDRVAAADASEAERTEFMRKTYLHLGGAVLAFAALSTLLVKSPVAPAMLEFVGGSRWNWLIILASSW